jgi:hypothetical protein
VRSASRGRFIRAFDRGTLKGTKFFARQWTPLPWLELSISEGANAGTNQANHRMLNGITHTTDLAISTFVNREAENSWAEKCRLRWSGDPVFEHDSLAKHAEFAPSRLPFNVGDILLFDSKGWMSQPMGEISIVGKEQQPLCVHVEATYRKDAWLFWYQFENGWTSLRIVSGRYNTCRFIQKQMNKTGSNADDDAIDGDFIGLSGDSTSQFCNFAVNRHSAFGDEILANPPTSDADAGQHLLKALSRSFLVGHTGPSPSSK